MTQKDDIEASTEVGKNLPKIGGTFGRFKILDLLGRGGMGQIFRVLPVNEPTASPMALKVIDSHSLSKVERLRFEREFRLASTCDHKFLAKALKYGTWDGRPYYTMEFIEGTDFRSHFGSLDKEMNSKVLPKL